jgi:hypothetical protein
MDRPPPYQRPPDRSPNYQYAPPTSQAQQPLHAPYPVDAYSMPRRDPFFPSAPQHVRHNSQGLPGGNNAPQGAAEGQGQAAWPNSGTHTFLFREGNSTMPLSRRVGGWARSSGWTQHACLRATLQLRQEALRVAGVLLAARPAGDSLSLSMSRIGPLGCFSGREADEKQHPSCHDLGCTTRRMRMKRRTRLCGCTAVTHFTACCSRAETPKSPAAP